MFSRRQILAILGAGSLATVAYSATFRFLCALALTGGVMAVPASAQPLPLDPVAPSTVSSPSGPTVAAALTNVTRIDGWSFFSPLAGGGEPDYTMFGNRATLGITVDSARVGLRGSFQYAQLVGLPRDAFGPGPLGPGALFNAAAENTKAYQLYIKSMSLQVKDIVQGLSAEVGRMPYESSDGTAFAGRLIGNAEWTVFERAFDGARADFERGEWRLHGAFVMPTQGAFEESASPTIGKVKVSTVSARYRALDAFAHHYRDTRAVRARPDNSGPLPSAVDLGVRTVGASWEGQPFARHRVLEPFSVALWGAVQRGDWYGQSHRAASGSASIGYAWSQAKGRPAVEAGMLYASGDDDPQDDHHETFFAMVPTTRVVAATTLDALSGTYAQMNLRDAHVRVGITPHDRFVLSAELHRLSLATPFDRWYSGTGATAFSGNYFGFSARSSTLRSDLGTLLQMGASANVTRFWRLSAALAVVRGGAVIERQFAGRTLRAWVVESRVNMR